MNKCLLSTALFLENLLDRGDDGLRRVLGAEVLEDHEAAKVISVDGAEPLDELAKSLEVALWELARSWLPDVVGGVELGDEGIEDDLELLAPGVHLKKSDTGLAPLVAAAVKLDVLEGLDGSHPLRDDVDLLSLALGVAVALAPEEFAAEVLDGVITVPHDVAASGLALEGVEEVADSLGWVVVHLVDPVVGELVGEVSADLAVIDGGV